MTDNHQNSPPKCVKEVGCTCRHKLRWYILDSENYIKCGESAKPYLDWCEPGCDHIKIDSEQLYKLTQCNCCERHKTKRPTWDELVRLCPALKNKPTIKHLINVIPVLHIHSFLPL